ncbi:MAG: hypothetical protein NZ954_03215 [Thermofilaceae archaeon]|nr:hypothetical protein [Thermofilaceae archaeon]MCX8181064.1 hypothetical protein [Thermofilaceae archaeon]MDW8004545.1 hypothetical protein [Thermofilaceae archaeon]
MSSMAAELLNAFRRELESVELLELEEDFYHKVRSWLISLKSSGSSSQLDAEILLEKSKETIKKLFLLRTIKELNYIWSKDTKPDVRIPREEAVMIECILNLISKICGTEDLPLEPEPEASDQFMVLVSFMKPYTKLMLADGRVIGPFIPGDLVIIPKRDAVELERHGVAKRIMEIYTTSVQ